MKRVWKNKDAVSPVIATILMVAITVVLAAVLYVMVIGMGGDTGIETPLGLNQQPGRTSTNVTVLISSAPNGALIDSSTISLVSGGTPTQIQQATVYSSAAIIIGTYNGATGLWTGVGNTEFTAGMSIVIQTVDPPGVSNGDVITFASIEEYFGTTTLTVN